jgi:hypothetical protein
MADPSDTTPAVATLIAKLPTLARVYDEHYALVLVFSDGDTFRLEHVRAGAFDEELEEWERPLV